MSTYPSAAVATQAAAHLAHVAGLWRTEEERGVMPDLGELIMHTSLGVLTASDTSCEQCRRTPLAGERTHELDSGSVLCELCFAELPADRRHAVHSRRVHVGERPLAVAPKAA